MFSTAIMIPYALPTNFFSTMYLLVDPLAHGMQGHNADVYVLYANPNST